MGAGEGETARLEMLLADEENRRARSVILLIFSTCLLCAGPGVLEHSVGDSNRVGTSSPSDPWNLLTFFYFYGFALLDQNKYVSGSTSLLNRLLQGQKVMKCQLSHSFSGGISSPRPVSTVHSDPRSLFGYESLSITYCLFRKVLFQYYLAYRFINNCFSQYLDSTAVPVP